MCAMQGFEVSCRLLDFLRVFMRVSRRVDHAEVETKWSRKEHRFKPEVDHQLFSHPQTTSQIT